ncbi:hypothetical protein VNO80_05532 [Phaseolus coccineus]|uniref:Uncharacterized protein n=1 Tax=Phaseolus coccineus TaxID=3886 RepID=A0AAN9NGE7_PHACN
MREKRRGEREQRRWLRERRRWSSAVRYGQTACRATGRVSSEMASEAVIQQLHGDAVRSAPAPIHRPSQLVFASKLAESIHVPHILSMGTG